MRSRPLTVTAFLLAGAVVNVAVAWVILWKKDWTPVFPAQRQVGDVWPWPRDVPPHWPVAAETSVRAEGSGVLGLSYHARRTSDEGMERFGIATYRAGWPMLGLAWDNWQESFSPNSPDQPSFRSIARTAGHPPPGWWNFGIRMERSVAYLAGPMRRMHDHIPIRPSWPAFAINTLFYAAILWLLIPGPFVLRRFIRRRRGLCPACAYPRGEPDVCTECGIPLVPG